MLVFKIQAWNPTTKTYGEFTEYTWFEALREKELLENQGACAFIETFIL